MYGKSSMHKHVNMCHWRQARTHVQIYTTLQPIERRTVMEGGGDSLSLLYMKSCSLSHTHSVHWQYCSTITTILGMESLHVSQSNLTEEHETHRTLWTSPTIVSTLRDHVSEIHSFTKHVTCHWSLRWRYTQTCTITVKEQSTCDVQLLDVIMTLCTVNISSY